MLWADNRQCYGRTTDIFMAGQRTMLWADNIQCYGRTTDNVMDGQQTYERLSVRPFLFPRTKLLWSL